MKIFLRRQAEDCLSGTISRYLRNLRSHGLLPWLALTDLSSDKDTRIYSSREQRVEIGIGRKVIVA